MRWLATAVWAVAAGGGAGVAGAAPGGGGNAWRRVEAAGAAGYVYSRPVYVPSRGCVLHWGAVSIGDSRPWMRNDVRAFDAAGASWASDYPAAEKLPGLNFPHGKGSYYRGRGEMLPCGTPAPSMVCDAVCYDSRRDEVIYVMPGLMAAYDPQRRSWRDMKARVLLAGRELPGGPPVYGAGACYDPVNDEIVLFPHWGGWDTELRDATGEMRGHHGTFVYRFTDNTWRTAGRRYRREAVEEMSAVSDAMDAAWRGRRDRSAGPDLAAGRARLARLRAGPAARARVEPPPRCGAPMVYHPGVKGIVLFGGQDGLVRTDLGRRGGPGGLNDTWLYDCRTRTWRELACPDRPPAQRRPRLACDPASKRVLLVTRRAGEKRGRPGRITLWGLDVAAERWFRLHEADWPWEFGWRHCTGWRPDEFEIALDAGARLLVLTQNVREGKRPVGQTYVLDLRASKLSREPAPAWRPSAPVRPIRIPPADGDWLARLAELPPNTWVHADPPNEPARRDWGNLACDPVRGWAVYFGGGHSTYQVNNPAVYVVAANRWVTTAGEHNDLVPPVCWGGCSMSLRGGPHAHHQRNEYVALDGRMYRTLGGFSRRWGPGQLRPRFAADEPGRFAWFHDIDRGGVWRQRRCGPVVLGEGVPDTFARAHVVDPAGRVMGFGGSLEPYDGRVCRDEAFFGIHDVRTGRLEVRKIPDPRPGVVMECRPFCYLAGKDAVFFHEFRRSREGTVLAEGTWVYEIAANRFRRLRPRRRPVGLPGTVVHVPDQNAVYAVIHDPRTRRAGQWMYSFARNTWVELTTAGQAVRFPRPYTQLVYVPTHKVLVNVPRTALMRPRLPAGE